MLERVTHVARTPVGVVATKDSGEGLPRPTRCSPVINEVPRPPAVYRSVDFLPPAPAIVGGPRSGGVGVGRAFFRPRPRGDGARVFVKVVA